MIENTYDIAVTSKRKEAVFAEQLAVTLEKSGMRVWLDRWCIQPGTDFTTGLISGVAEIDVLCVCIGPSIPPDSHTIKAILKAHAQKPSQTVLPILLKGTPPESVPPKLRALSSTNRSPDTDGKIVKLIEALVSMGEMPAVSYLLQYHLTDQASTGFFRKLFNLSDKIVVEEPKDDEKTASQPRSSRDAEVAAAMELARSVLRGHYADPKELLTLASELKRAKQFGYARRVLARARMNPALIQDSRLRLMIFQQSALCTYKDPDLSADTKFDQALDILRHAESLDETINQETLGLAGAIYKRKWEVDNQKEQLERSLNYYLRGYEQGPVTDQGYTGINAAFVLDLLAHQEEDEARKARITSEIAQHRREKAKQIRTEIVEQVAPLIDDPQTNWLEGRWWYYSTVAEAHFGLGNYDEAIEWLRRGETDAEKTEIAVAAWERESTARQLAALARLPTGPIDTADSPQVQTALTALSKFFHKYEVQSAYVGKIGLALSGGGFRAALFHIGVLARLAELDVLRRVEALSCVSGGAIIGAHYYLEVRKLLQTKPDSEISREDYIEIIARVRKDFLEGVQRNVRTRVALNPLKTLKMILRSKYSRTMRAGELYESEIFSRVKDEGEYQSRWLSGLYVWPVDDKGTLDQDFNLKTDNWRRAAKVPNLILNTTALNTGHNWQFTASWMGEPPAIINDAIDGNDRFRRLYYDGSDTPVAHRNVRLGHAVAASACVPGLFEPLPLDQLYPDRVVRLVDGGVCDNQGVASLLDQDCNVILVSDGSGQMESDKDPSIGLVGVPLRSNSILQARVREAQYHELAARKRASLLRGFMFVHLKEDLDVDPIDWIGCLDPFDASDDARPAYRRGPLTRYGVAKEAQELLSGVRTDLDSFSDVEAFSLMTSGYRMTEHAFKFQKCVEGFPEPDRQYPWDFLAVEEGLRGSGPKYEFLKKRLRASSSRAFKIWQLSGPLRLVALALGIATLMLGVWAWMKWSGVAVVIPPISVRSLGMLLAFVVLAVIVAVFLLKKVAGIHRLTETLIRCLAYVLIGPFGALASLFHLQVFDRMFLRDGSLESFNKKT